MKLFLAGLAIGLLLGWGLTVTFSGPGPDLPKPSRPAPDVEAAQIEPSSRSKTPPPLNRDPAGNDDRGAFAAGTAILMIGDRYVFGADQVLAPGDGREGDLLCQDIRHGASLRCPHGTIPADVPLAATGLPETPAEVATLLTDAPNTLPKRDAQLVSHSNAQQTGVVLVRADSGATYKVWLVREEPNPAALKRRVHIAYATVPTKDGGGVLHLPTASPLGDAAPTRKDIEALVKVGSSIPGDSFARFISGSYTRLSEYPEKLELTEQQYLLVDEPLRTEVTFPRRGGLYAAAGIAPEGRVVLDSYSGVGVKGDMAGTVDVKSYGYVHITGNLTGQVNINSYATVVIDGDILGKLKVRSYTDLLLRGRIIGKLDAQGSCWSTFYFENYTSQRELEELPGNFGSVTLHVRESDLAPGKHKDIGTWREVIVGDKVWEKLAR